MRGYLLDVNVLIALMDPNHVSHDVAHNWFERIGVSAWATCSVTECGFIRIVSNPRYPNSIGTPAAAVSLLSGFCSQPGHEFWPDKESLLTSALCKPDRLLSHGQVTDTYLLNLAAQSGGKLVSLDRRLVTSAVRNGDQILQVI